MTPTQPPAANICQKIGYSTRGAALEDAKFIKLQVRHRNKKLGCNVKSNRKLRPYECRHCGAWHLTSQSKIKGK